jgi:TonB family protein
MSAHRSVRCAAGRVLLVLSTLSLFSAPAAPRQAPAAATQQPHTEIAALAERLATQLLASEKRRVFILDLTLPGDAACPLGAWLADRIAESLTQAHPELDVIPRALWTSKPLSLESLHDQNQVNAAKEEHARSLGAEVVVTGNFAAVADGIGVTLLARDSVSAGKSRFEALAELPLTTEMQSILTSRLPDRVVVDGAFWANTAGIGAPVCEECPAPQYTYVAAAKKLSGVVILAVRVTSSGVPEFVKLVRAPNPALANAALRTVRTWRFRPAFNARGDFVPVITDVVVSFRLEGLQRVTVSAANRQPH